MKRVNEADISGSESLFSSRDKQAGAAAHSTKICKCCLAEKSLSAFSKHTLRVGGLRDWCRACNSQKANNRKAGRPTHLKESVWASQGIHISYKEYEDTLCKQDYKCAVCKTTFNNWRGVNGPNVDHCHTKGGVRGIICRPCNIAIGLFKDSVITLKSAVTYLEKYEKSS
mgnify:CR=1 FL=1